MMTNDGVFTCKTNNVIYLITCTKCSLQYVGKTETPLHKRMNGHRSSCNDVFKNLYLVNHFKQEGHNFGDAHIQIIDHFTHDDNSSLSDKEDFWIDMLNTAYPLGLNDNIRRSGNISQRNVFSSF